LRFDCMLTFEFLFLVLFLGLFYVHLFELGPPGSILPFLLPIPFKLPLFLFSKFLAFFKLESLLLFGTLGVKPHLLELLLKLKSLL
jgi:hypothetical protein